MDFTKLLGDLEDGKLPQVEVSLSPETFIGLGITITIPAMLIILVYFVAKSIVKK